MNFYSFCTFDNRLQLFGVRTSLYSIEESVIDRETKTLVLYARNITFTTPTQFVEKATYTVSPENRKWSVLQVAVSSTYHSSLILDRTTSTKQAWMEFSFYGLSSMLEKSTIDHYKNGAEQVKAFSSKSVSFVSIQADLALLQVLASQGDTTHASYRM